MCLNKRELNLKEQGVSGKRYKELCGFCEQYPEWLEELKCKADTMKSKGISDMPAPPLGCSDETGNLAIRRVELQKKCELIEQTAIEADSDLYRYIIDSVCHGIPFCNLRGIMGIPCSRTSFYDKRRYFFFLLDKKK